MTGIKHLTLCFYLYYVVYDIVLYGMAWLINLFIQMFEAMIKNPVALIHGKAFITGAHTAQTGIIIRRPGVAKDVL